ncbi:hypothetical protein Psta_0139 [Pirellula staleyi DSM 6068]|uniref:DUF6745 domain-containing protein n=1 Tax=Pirellula staleyi (strain ATCC 27377 / DSM 6068 / ICPB 4128) TaxID=530564 RepID=D2R0G7_PIRSD|nr:hypothetical protein Psta_0139 [Pirellula staleyi DSM 6068]
MAEELPVARETYEALMVKQILEGTAPAGLRVDGKLNFFEPGLPRLTQLPAGLSCYELDATGTDLVELPSDLQVECVLTLANCVQLKSLPPDLHVGTLNVSGCRALTELPEGLEVWFLDISRCDQIQKFPASTRIEHGGLSVNGCTALTSLPESLTHLGTLDVGNCPQIKELPPQLQVTSWIEIAGSGLTSVPQHLEEHGIRWRGVQIDRITAFEPEKLQAKIILKERNAERRRVMIERMGFDRFMLEAGAETLDRDRDPGGPRELLRVPMQGDEAIVSLSCRCPSTGRHYVLRVPPTMKSCRQAAAWMAGFDDPEKYQPVKET